MDERLEEEERHVRTLRRLTDLVCWVVSHAPVTLPEADALKRELRNVAERLFPDRVHVFDLVIAPRLRRLVRDRFVVRGGRDEEDG